MTRPVLWIFGFLICGIVLGAYGSLPLFGLVILLGLFLCYLLYRGYKYGPVFVFVLFLALGFWRAGHSLHSHTTYPGYVTLSGIVQDVGITAGGNQRVIVRLDNGMQVMAYIRLHMPQAELGQEIIMTGELRPLSLPQNPGGYNQFQHLRSQKIDATIWPDTVTLGEVQLSITVVLRMVRDRIAAVYDTLLPPREAAILRSMVLGDRARLDQDLADQYRTMGIFHILSISGLHVGILMMAFSGFLGVFLSERRASIIVLVIMVLYCLMTGASASTVRAVTMGGLLIFGKILGRDYDLLVSVSWAGVALLIYEPLFLFNVGFQLSFVAVFGIGILSPAIDRLLAKARFPRFGKFRRGFAVGIAASVSTYPVFGFHFYEISLYSIVGNLVIGPTAAIILILGIIVGLLGLVWITGAGFLIGTVYYILRFYEMASGFFSELPHAMLLTGGGNLIIAGLGAAVLLSFVYAFNGFGEVFRRRLRLFGFTVVLLIAAVFVRHNPRGLYVTQLSTFGNYTVLRHGGDVLIAGAPRGSEHTLLQYLDRHGVFKANGLVLIEPPRPQDAHRLLLLTERISVLYVRYDFFEEVATLMYGRDVEIVRIYNGTVRIADRKAVWMQLHPAGRVGLYVQFGETAINIKCGVNAAHVQVYENIVTTENKIFDTRDGAVRLHLNGRRVRIF